MILSIGKNPIWTQRDSNNQRSERWSSYLLVYIPAGGSQRIRSPFGDLEELCVLFVCHFELSGLRNVMRH